MSLVFFEFSRLRVGVGGERTGTRKLFHREREREREREGDEALAKYLINHHDLISAHVPNLVSRMNDKNTQQVAKSISALSSQCCCITGRKEGTVIRRVDENGSECITM